MTRARMIQLESRSTAVQSDEIKSLSNLIIEPVILAGDHNVKQSILSQNKELTELLDGASDFSEAISSKGFYEKNGWRVIKRSGTNYQQGRVLMECLAIKVNPNRSV
jgi:uncharacterized coiled-coil protein SlyX